MFFVGVDAHQKSCHLTVVDDSGAIRGRIRTASTRVALQSALARFEGPKRAVLEAGWGWGVPSAPPLAGAVKRRSL